MLLIKKIVWVFFSILLLFALVINNEAVGKTIIDMEGREVEIPERIDRIITTYRPATEFIFALGANERLVAVEMDTARIGLFTTIMPHIEDLPVIGSRRGGLNLEQIVALSPDLVILFPYEDGREAARKLEEVGIASLIIDPENFEKIRQTNLLLGEVLGLERQAEKVDMQFKSILSWAADTGELCLDSRTSVYFANMDLFDTVGDGMLQTKFIQLSGGYNPVQELKSGFVKVSLEQLIQWNPDFIILSQFNEKSISEIKERSQYSSLKAVREGNVFRIPSNIYPWDFPGPSSFLSILWLSQKIVPDKHEHIHIQTIVDDFYFTLFGRTFTQLGGKLE